MACASCGDTVNTNPLDSCTTGFSCNNPCAAGPGNTATCEALPSQIENFTVQFFGQVIKTEIDGVVTWSLPCGLDIGLPANPRGADEGLACYFLRLFTDGIVGLTGPQGNPGNNGTDGRNAYTVTIASFTQPSLGSPNVNVTTVFNPAILDGTYVFIGSSGWYFVNSSDPNSGILFLTLVKSAGITPDGGTVSAGKLVIESGFPGAQGAQGVQGIQGPKGDPGATGPKGDTGAAGTDFTTTHEFYHEAAGTNYDLANSYNEVNFIASTASVVLPTAGTYLITAVAEVVGLMGVATTDVVTLKLRNTSTATDDVAEHRESNIAQDEIRQVTINTILTTAGAAQTISIFGKCTSASAVTVAASFTTITAVKISS